MQLTLRPEALTRSLSRIVLALLAAHIIGQVSAWGFGHDSVFGLVPLFDLNAEVNVPTLYAVLSLTLCAVLMGVIARVRYRMRQPGSLHWAGLASVMSFLALDEFASLHERLSDPVRASLEVGGVLTSAWVLP